MTLITFSLDLNHATLWLESQVAPDSNYTVLVSLCQDRFKSHNFSIFLVGHYPNWFGSHFKHDSNRDISWLESQL